MSNPSERPTAEELAATVRRYFGPASGSPDATVLHLYEDSDAADEALAELVHRVEQAEGELAAAEQHVKILRAAAPLPAGEATPKLEVFENGWWGLDRMTSFFGFHVQMVEGGIPCLVIRAASAPPLPASDAASNGWLPIATAPHDGRHILIADFTPGRAGFGFCGDPLRAQPWQCVVHYWSNPGEEGFYLSSGNDDNPVLHATHWQELRPASDGPTDTANGWAPDYGVALLKENWRTSVFPTQKECSDSEAIALEHCIPVTMLVRPRSDVILKRCFRCGARKWATSEDQICDACEAARSLPPHDATPQT